MLRWLFGGFGGVGTVTVLWTVVIVFTLIAAMVSIGTSSDSFGLNGVLELAALVVGLVVWFAGIGLISLIAWLFGWRHQQPAPRPRQF